MIALLLLLGINKRWLVPILLVLLAVGVAASRIDSITKYGFARYLISLVSRRHILMFVVGVVISMVSDYLPVLQFRKTYSIIGFTFLMIGYGVILNSRYSFIISLGVSTIIFLYFLIFQPIAEKMGVFNNIMTFLGDISFSIYLLHYVIIRVLYNLGIDKLGLLLPISFVVTIMISSITYFGIERPFMRLAKRDN